VTAFRPAGRFPPAFSRKEIPMFRPFRITAVGLLAALGVSAVSAADPGPKVGDEAKDFELAVLGGKTAKLSDLAKGGPVVLVVLRGNPGYQCPICSTQFAGFRKKADAFKAAGAKVVFVYPGPADKLKERADEFVKGKDYPEHFQFLLDPDYTFTNAYGLRWDAKNETAYPSTFVVGKDRRVTFARVSTTHGGRVSADDALKAVGGK
jgi:peroxiredoxin